MREGLGERFPVVFSYAVVGMDKELCSPHAKQLSTASSSSLALSAVEVPSIIRQMSSIDDGQPMFSCVCQSSVKGDLRYCRNIMGEAGDPWGFQS
jgi:hypothetical protein